MGKKIFLTEEQFRSIIREYFRKQVIPHYSMHDKLELGYDPNVVDGGNFPIKRNGREYWISRSMVISLYVFGYDKNGRLNILANKRGPKARGGNGCWNVIGGFLDYGQTLEDTCVKECWEECGVKIDKKKLISIGVNSSRNHNRGDVSARYYTILDNSIENHTPSIDNCEPGEVVMAAWIPIDDMIKYKWWGSQGKKAHDFAEKIIKKKDILNSNNDFNAVMNGLSKLLKDNVIDKRQFETIINIIKR